MYFSNHFHKAFINLAGSVATSGETYDLAPGQLAFADAKTWDIIAPASASVTTHPLVVLCQGSLYQNDKITKFHGGYKETVKSRPINGRFITKFTKHSPVAEKPHIVQIGYYNSATDCACPEFEADKYYNFRVEVKGSPVLRAYTRNLYRVFGIHTGACTVPEGSGGDAGIVDPKLVFENIAAQIKADPEIAQFLKEVKVVVQGSTAPTTTAFVTYTASRCDAGDIVAFSEVAVAYPTATMLSRAGAETTYQIIKSGAAPTDDVNSTGLTWTAVQTQWKATKKICLTLPLKADGSSNLSDVITALASNTNVVSGSVFLYDEAIDGTTTTTTSSTTSTTTTSTTKVGDGTVGCTETIQALIYSDDYIDFECEGTDVAVSYTMPQSYNGYMWEECPCEALTANVDQCVGLRLKAKTSDEVTDKFSNCSFDQFDHVETEPITIIVSFVNEFGEACEFNSMPVITVQNPVIPQGLGELALRELLQSSLYSQDFWLSDPRMREVIQYPYLQAIDRNKNYVVYTLAHTIPTSIGPSGTIGQDRFLYRIFVEEGVSATNFETWMSNYLTSAGTGVSMETL
jgi:hypothetical protein